MHLFKKYLLLLFTMTLLFSQVSLVSAAEPIEEVRSLIEQHYVDEVPATTLSKPTIKEMTDQHDPYSVFMTKQEYDRFTNSINQELVGIGVVLEEHEQGVRVTQTIPDGPAEQAGILAGDIITYVDGESLQGQSIPTAVSFISGMVHTYVTITYLQQSTGLAVTKTIERKKLSLPIVEAEMLGGDVGYIRLHSFSMDATAKIQTAIDSLNGAKSFILDLRDNGGGYVSAAQEVAGLFPNVEQAFQLQDRSLTPTNYPAIKQNTQFKEPVHILINGNSASASEMVSAAVKEQEGAKLYGQTTYGKGSMQSLFQLSDNSELKLTTAKFYSPNGTVINKTGVAPNIETSAGEELAWSHRDQLINMYNTYKQLPSLQNVPTTKTFTIEMNTGMNWDSLSSNDVQLIHLGGEEVKIDLQKVNEKSLKVVPKQPMLSNEKYILFIHPVWKSKSNLAMKQGIYLEISVSK
jgi:carboxyl-terminal processing protease